MSKIQVVIEKLAVIKELWDAGSSYFEKSVPNDFFRLMDKMAFLTSDFLGLDSSGEILDNTEKIAEAILSLTNVIMWGLLLFYGFRSIFSYFISKKVDVPWKAFIRIIVFGVFANASFFICYTGIFFAENSTEYVKSYVGDNNFSFSILEEYVEVNAEVDDEERDVYSMEILISVCLYFSTFLTAVCLGGRYILLKVLILLSPVFFLLGGFRFSEKIFCMWCKTFFVLLFMQVFFACFLGSLNLLNIDNDMFLQILICSTLFIFCKNIFCFLKLYH